MIADVALPPVRSISQAAGVGWLVTHAAESSATVLDAGLRIVTRFDAPVRAQRFMASAGQRHLAAVTLDELVVCDHLGQVLWRREHSIPRAGLPCTPNCHLDAQGVLWVYLPTGDELVAYDAATGAELDRARLDSSVGAAYFFPHPDGERLGLHVGMGQDAPLSHLAWLAGGRIHGRDLPGPFLNGFTSAGDRYLALPHGDVAEIAMRTVSTGAIVVARGSTEIEGRTGDSDHRLMEAAALVSDDFVLVAVNTDDDGDFERHLLLSTRSLRWQADVDYDLDMTQNAIAATDGQGRWLTRGPDATVRLWQLPDRVTDEIPGQLDLW
ncbi:hypothetical protein SAMN06264365_107163 [Actinoplanes regularis]|uniref:Uncharacterized protein n=2 Tax=Actinoplanes regularis TaxID=52697 RepID=A0A239A960_9ACTN|nr:hypothetical protein SAMN06264365_107163 [Actinoplanes regularis]